MHEFPFFPGNTRMANGGGQAGGVKGERENS